MFFLLLVCNAMAPPPPPFSDTASKVIGLASTGERNSHVVLTE